MTSITPIKSVPNSIKSVFANQNQIDPLGLSPIPEDTRQRFLRFKLLGANQSLFPLRDIAEVKQLSITDILPIPDVNSSVLGVCNWRGDILWLIDLNALLGDRPLWTQVPQLEQPTAIIVQSAQRPIGFLIEHVDDVELIAPESLLDSIELSSSTLAPYVTGYLPDHGGMVLDAIAIIKNLLQEPP
ncbi:MAG: chemotaxis protein CheW [Leptolyngbyaceae cyanobacterium MAG.088]|nr:chemotaxis protein CheW [Leptolyngbyaceae cyanobacterium MAG.088]